MDPKDRVLTASGDPQAGDVDVPEGEFETDSPGGESDEGEAADGGEGGEARPAAEGDAGQAAFDPYRRRRRRRRRRGRGRGPGPGVPGEGGGMLAVGRRLSGGEGPLRAARRAGRRREPAAHGGPGDREAPR